MQDNREVLGQNIQLKFVVDAKNPKNKPEEGMVYAFQGGKFLPILGVQPFGTQVTTPKAPREALEQEVVGATEAQLKGNKEAIFEIDKIDYTDDGIYIYYKELLYPKKGLIYPEVCIANNMAKRCLVSSLRAFTKNPLMALLLLRKKSLEIFIHEYCSFADIAVDKFYLKPEFYSKTAKEMNKFITNFLTTWGVKPGILGKIVGHLFEFEDAYMYRFQDIMNEADKDTLLKNPGKEVLRLISIYRERESRISFNDKTKGLFFLAKFIFLFPGIKKAFLYAVKQADFTRLAMEKCDRYHVLRWDNGYKFLGRTLDDRKEEFLRLHKGVVPKFMIATAD